MKRAISSFLFGLVFAFWVAQLAVFYNHGFSFTVAFHFEAFFIVGGFFWLAVLLLGYFGWRIFRGHRVALSFGRLELAFFLLGVLVVLLLAFWLKSLEPPDYKVLPYIVIPKLFVVALAGFWVLVLINFRPTSVLNRTRVDDTHTG